MNGSTSHSPLGQNRSAAPSFNPHRLSRRLIFVALTLALASGALVFWSRQPAPEPPPPPPGPVVVLPRSFVIPRQPIPLFARLIPNKLGWGWLWRLRSVFMGRAKVVHLNFAAFSFNEPPDPAALATLPRRPEVSEKNGLRIWLLNGDELKTFQQTLKLVPGSESRFAASVQTADGMEAQIFTGTSISGAFPAMEAGLSVDCLPRIRQGKIDLLAIHKLTELRTNNVEAATNPESTGAIMLQTNFALAARFQITNQGGVFILGQRPSTPNCPLVALLITGKIPGRK